MLQVGNKTYLCIIETSEINNSTHISSVHQSA